MKKYDKVYLRMMIKIGLTIGIIMVITSFLNLSLVRKSVIFLMLMVTFFLISRFYYGYLNNIEIKEKLGV